MVKKEAHRICQHASGPIKMQRLYVRQDLTFVPIGWSCLDCKQMVKD